MAPLQVEQYYVGQGWLLPSYHKSYWIGLTATTWPYFHWLEPSNDPSDDTYIHWGLLLPAGLMVSLVAPADLGLCMGN
jgi:hypothetical protein